MRIDPDASLAESRTTVVEAWADRRLRRWLLCGPFPAFGTRRPPTDWTKLEPGLRKAMATDFLGEHGGETGITPTLGMTHATATGACQWQAIESDTDLVDLTTVLPGAGRPVAYAWAELHIRDTGPMLLTVGSEARYQNGVQIWINGQLIYDRSVLRRTRSGDDLVLAELQSGANTVLIKVTSVHAGWGFTFGAVGPEFASQALLNAVPEFASQALLNAVSRGQLAVIEHLLDRGAPIAAVNRMGETALHQAARHDQRDAAALLLARGASADVLTPGGVTPHHLAAQKGHQDCAALLSGAGADVGIRPTSDSDRVDALFAGVEADAPGAAVVVAKNGTVVYSRGFGLATHLPRPEPITAHTAFPIASTSKSFLATAIWLLHERNTLDVSDPISRYLPEYPRGDDITLYHLLTHTSGVRYRPSKQTKLDYEPGTSWAYTDAGYELLGKIIRRVAGVSFRVYLREELFLPLDLRNTKSVGTPGGGVESSADDVFRFYDALVGGRIVSADTLEAAFAPARLADGTLAQTGWPWAAHCTPGWHVTTVGGRREIAHRGNFTADQTEHRDGFSAYAAAYPEQAFIIVVLKNCDPPQVLPRVEPHQSVAEIDPSVLVREIAGIYLYDG